MKQYVVTRKARNNPAIRGATLYLTDRSMWSLEKENARIFDTKAEANKLRGPKRLAAQVVEK